MAEYVASTFGTPAPVIENIPQQNITNQTESTQTNNEPSTTIVAPNGSLETTPTQPAAVIETPSEDSDIKFEMPEGYQPEPQSTDKIEVSQPQSVKDILSKFNDEQRAELIKELGIDEFALNLNKHIKNGGKAEDYLSAKAIDYVGMPPERLVLEDLKRQNPNLSQDKLQKLFDFEYKQSDSYSDEEKEIGSIRLEANAENIRQKRLAEQQSFKIPEVAPQTTSNTANDEAVKQQLEQRRNYFANHDVTKSILQSKRVAIDTGEGTFNVQIDNPQLLLDMITKPEVNAKFGVNKQGEPDVQLLNEMALYKLNPLQFKKSLIERGRRLGRQQMVEEGQNPSRPNQQTSPTPKQDEKAAWQGAKMSKFGSN